MTSEGGSAGGAALREPGAPNRGVLNTMEREGGGGAAAGSLARLADSHEQAPLESADDFEEDFEALDEMASFVVRTPEMVEFSYELAGPASRFLAWAVDGIIIIAVCATVALLAMSFCLFTAIVGAGGVGGVVIALASVAAYFVMTFYHIYFDMRWRGQSPGKKALGLRVMSTHGVRLSLAQSVVRNLLRALDAQPLLSYLVAVASIGLTRNGQRLGDLLADTVVVREHRRVLPSELRLPQARYNSFLADPTFASRIGRALKPAERELLVELVMRRDELDLEARSRIFEALANHFRARLVLHLGANVEDRHLSHENWVLNLTQALVSGDGLQDVRTA